MNFLSNVLREDGGFEYKKAIVDSILILIKDIPDAKEPGLGHLCEFIEVRGRACSAVCIWSVNPLKLRGSGSHSSIVKEASLGCLCRVDTLQVLGGVCKALAKHPCISEYTLDVCAAERCGGRLRRLEACKRKGVAAAKQDCMAYCARLMPAGIAASANVSLCCDILQDCEFTYLSTQILHVLGDEGPKTKDPSKYIRFIYNRIILENATVRAAAVSSLAKFGALVEDLRERVKVLLSRALHDNDDEVSPPDCGATLLHCHRPIAWLTWIKVVYGVVVAGYKSFCSVHGQLAEMSKILRVPIAPLSVLVHVLAGHGQNCSKIGIAIWKGSGACCYKCSAGFWPKVWWTDKDMPLAWHS